MTKYAPSGDQPLRAPLDQWPGLLMDPDVKLQLGRQWFGHAVRTDRWHCRNLSRPWHTLYLVLDGVITGQVANRPYRLAPHSFFWLNPNTPHDMTWPPRLVFTELWFRLVRNNRPVCLPDPVMVLDDAGETLPVMRQIEVEMALELPHADQKLRHLLALLVIELLRVQGKERGGAILSPAQCRQLRQFAREHTARRPALDELAAVADLSPDYFSRVFARTFGCSPREWMVRERTSEAARLLATSNLAVYQVADHLGYENVSQFSRQFKQQTGQSPRQFRQRHT